MRLSAPCPSAPTTDGRPYLHTRRQPDKPRPACLAHPAPCRAGHTCPAVEHPHAVYRRLDGGAARSRRGSVGGADEQFAVAVLGAVLGRDHRLCRAGRPSPGSVKLRRGPRCGAPGHHGMPGVQRRSHSGRLGHRFSPAALAQRRRGHLRRCLDVLCHICGSAADAYHELSGRRYAPQRRQHESAQPAQRGHVPDGCRIQLVSDFPHPRD